MKNIIIYNDENLRVVHCHSAIKEDVVQEADKVVPHAVPYKIIDSSEIPADRTFRNAWEVDDSEITYGVGGELKAKLDLIDAESTLTQQNERLATKEAEAKAAKEHADGEHSTDEEREKAEQASKDAQKAVDDAKAVVSACTERVTEAKKMVQECLDALPLDKRSTE